MCLHFLAETWGSDQYKDICTTVADNKSFQSWSESALSHFPAPTLPSLVGLSIKLHTQGRDKTVLQSRPSLLWSACWLSLLQTAVHRFLLCAFFLDCFCKGRTVPAILHLSLGLEMASEISFFSNVKFAFTVCCIPSDINPPGHHLLIPLATLFCLFIIILLNIS